MKTKVLKFHTPENVEMFDGLIDNDTIEFKQSGKPILVKINSKPLNYGKKDFLGYRNWPVYAVYGDHPYTGSFEILPPLVPKKTHAKVKFTAGNLGNLVKTTLINNLLGSGNNPVQSLILLIAGIGVGVAFGFMGSQLMAGGV